jgi:hypothetical protein
MVARLGKKSITDCLCEQGFHRDLRDGVHVAPKEALFKVAKLNEIRMLSGASGSIAEVAPSHRRYNSIIINNLQDWWPVRHVPGTPGKSAIFAQFLEFSRGMLYLDLMSNE